MRGPARGCGMLAPKPGGRPCCLPARPPRSLKALADLFALDRIYNDIIFRRAAPAAATAAAAAAAAVLRLPAPACVSPSAALRPIWPCACGKACAPRAAHGTMLRAPPAHHPGCPPARCRNDDYIAPEKVRWLPAMLFCHGGRGLGARGPLAGLVADP